MSARVFAGAAMERPECAPLASGEAAVFSAPRPGETGGNEDAAAWVELGPERAVLAVADGLGGQPAGDKAARLALESVMSAVAGADPEGPALRHAILDGFERANCQVDELGVGAATTLVVAEIQGRTLRTYHVGDSMILVVGQRGRRKLQTVSHSPVGYAVEAGVLHEEDALHHEELHLISNMVGSDDMRIEMSSTRKLAPRDTVLLASDGLLDNLWLGEIVERIRKGPLPQAAGALVDAARRRMEGRDEGEPSKPDDLTFIAFRPRAGR